MCIVLSSRNTLSCKNLDLSHFSNKIRPVYCMIMTDYQDEFGITLFDNWYKQYSNLVDEVDGNKSHIKQVEQSYESTREKNLRLQEECNQLQKTNGQCHQQLELICELEDEIRATKTKLLQKEQELSEKTSQYKVDIENLKVSLFEECEEKTSKIKEECEEKVASLEKMLHDEQTAKAASETQLTNTLKEKDREISRIFMEFESKLAQCERQKARLMQQQQQVLNQDVMRRKMQHMKETHEKELAMLKSQILDLQGSGSAGVCIQQPHWLQPQSLKWQEQPQDSSPGPHRGRMRSKGRSMSMTKRSF
ncbi:hypothetical protein EGW08_012846 [Elysia chlorotica]|uniref:Uncharacterized protein n=1 Tax=Elysia chlorotica TaxID=188477 RepID=A0A433TCU4_ELYCH|nr:hypothetical protein EGW08_012846 [Elysia chlorotica]